MVLVSELKLLNLDLSGKICHALAGHRALVGNATVAPAITVLQAREPSFFDEAFSSRYLETSKLLSLKVSPFDRMSYR
jgi:hypothetical protein